jgi:hypothetical protein
MCQREQTPRLLTLFGVATKDTHFVKLFDIARRVDPTGAGQVPTWLYMGPERIRDVEHPHIVVVPDNQQ